MATDKISIPSSPTKLPPFQEALFVPERLRELKRWVYWEARWKASQSKWDKLPFVVATEKGKDWQKKENGAAYEDAVAAAPALGGIGFVMFPEDKLVAIDLDRVRDKDTGKIEPWAQAIINLKETYTEISPSGTGIRLFAEGDLDGEPAVVNVRAQVELYCAKKYLTFTGNHIAGTPVDVKPAPATILALVARARSGAGARPKGATVTPMVAGGPGRVLKVEPKLRAALVGKILGAIKNDIDVRDDWIGVAHAIDGALDGDDEAGFPIWMEFCSRWETGPSDPVEDKRVWDSRGSDGKAGIGTLKKLLEAQGTPEAVAVREEVSKAEAPQAFEAIPGSEKPVEPELLAVPEKPAEIDDAIGKVKDPNHRHGRSRRVIKGFERGEVTLVGGPAGAMKSLWMTQLAVAIAAGDAAPTGEASIDWCGNVVFYTNEDSPEQVLKRLDAILIRHGLKGAGFPFKLMLKTGRLLKREGNGAITSNKEEVTKLLGVKDLALVVVDTLAAALVSEETNVEFQQTMNLLKALAVKTKAVVAVVHHFRKGVPGAAGKAVEIETTLESLRGGSALTASARNVLFVERPSKGDVKSFGLANDGKGMMRVTQMKSSYGGLGDVRWFRLETVPIVVVDERDGKVGSEEAPALVPATMSATNARMAILRGALEKLKVEAAAGRVVKKTGKKSKLGGDVQGVLGVETAEANAMVEELVGLGAVRVVGKWIDGNDIEVLEIVEEWGRDPSGVGGS